MINMKKLDAAIGIGAISTLAVFMAQAIPADSGVDFPYIKAYQREITMTSSITAGLVVAKLAGADK